MLELHNPRVKMHIFESRRCPSRYSPSYPTQFNIRRTSASRWPRLAHSGAWSSRSHSNTSPGTSPDKLIRNRQPRTNAQVRNRDVRKPLYQRLGNKNLANNHPNTRVQTWISDERDLGASLNAHRNNMRTTRISTPVLRDRTAVLQP